MRVEQDFGIVPVDRVEFVVYVVLGSLAEVEIELDGCTIGMLHDQLDIVEMVPVPIPAYELVMGSPDLKKIICRLSFLTRCRIRIISYSNSLCGSSRTQA